MSFFAGVRELEVADRDASRVADEGVGVVEAAMSSFGG